MYGAGRMVIIYTIAGITGFALSTFMDLLPIPFFGAPLTVGASASIFGFLGALVHYGKRTGSSHARPGRAAVRAVHGHHGIRPAAASTMPRTSAASSAATWRR